MPLTNPQIYVGRPNEITPKCGTGQYKIHIDKEADEKVRCAYKDAPINFDPYHPILKASDIINLHNLLVFFLDNTSFSVVGKKCHF